MNMNENQVQERSTVANMMISRQAQEIQGAMVIAKKFPRNEDVALSKILNACQRLGLAEQATYEYPRAGTKVNGPSIRLAETLARNWGNIDYGIIELEQKDGKSEMMAYAWDLETNARATRIFTVKHWRDTKKGAHKLTDARDIYEITANMGARRVRSCILQTIPGYVVDEALEQCELTIKGSNRSPLNQRIKDMVKFFKDEYKVTKKMLEEFIGCNSNAFSEGDVRRLAKVYRSLKDGMASVGDYFGIDDKPTGSPLTQKKEQGAKNEEDEKFAADVKKALEKGDDNETNQGKLSFPEGK